MGLTSTYLLLTWAPLRSQVATGRSLYIGRRDRCGGRLPSVPVSWSGDARRNSSSLYREHCSSSTGRGYLMMAGANKKAREPAWSISRRARFSLRPQSGASHLLILSRDGRILGTFGWYPEDDAPLTRVFDTNTNEIIFEYPGGRAEVSGDGTMVLVGNDPTFLYDLSSGDRLQTYQGAFVRMRFLPNESRVVGVGPAGVVQIFDTESGAEVMRLRGHTSQIRTTSVTTGGNILVSSGDIAQMSPRGLGRAPNDGPHVNEPDRMAGISQSRSSKRISRRGPTLRCRARS